MELSRPVVTLVGPTASGKTALSQFLALSLDAEVVSADSMQIYRGMDIGTGKPKEEERLVPHFGFDLVSPGEAFSVALFQDYARKCFKDIDERGKVPLLVGGTGFYVRAALDDYRFPGGEQLDNPVRQHYTHLAQEKGSQAVWDLLHERDPESAAIIPPADTKRVIRAFELLNEGCTYAEQRRKLQSLPQLYPSCFLGLHVDPDILAKRIEKRVDTMIEEGFVEEVETLLKQGFREGITAPQAIGYKEIVAVLDGKQSLSSARETIKTATRRYAKRQRTWFRKDKRITWIDANDLSSEKFLETSFQVLRTQGFFIVSLSSDKQ